MMKIRLTYFNFPFWRAEASRLALHLGNIPFEDIRPTREEFMQMKASGDLPYGQLPVLQIDGTMIAQSVAIARFCGKQAKLYPQDDDVAAARVDELMDTATQITGLLAPSFKEKDVPKKLQLRRELAESTFPKWLGFLESRLKKNTDSDYFVGNEMTIADLIIWRLNGWLSQGVLDGIPRNILDAHPGLKSHFEMIDAVPQIRAWMSDHYGD
jgi:prostaglandin-H2 D-isomerase / glutathione transferase